MGISPSTMHKKTRAIREYLGLVPLEPFLTLASKIDENPMIWILNVNGMLMDIRTAPRGAQEGLPAGADSLYPGGQRRR